MWIDLEARSFSNLHIFLGSWRILRHAGPQTEQQRVRLGKEREEEERNKNTALLPKKKNKRENEKFDLSDLHFLSCATAAPYIST